MRALICHLFQPFHSTACAEKFVLTLMLIYEGVDFYILCGSLPICSWFSAVGIVYWKQLSSSFFGFIAAFLFLGHLGEFMYDWSPFVIVLWRTSYISKTQIETKVATLHWLFQTYFILLQKWIEKILDDFVCIITSRNFAAISFRIHHTFFVIICWWNKFRFHC